MRGASIGEWFLSRRDSTSEMSKCPPARHGGTTPIVAWHEVPGRRPSKEPSRRVRYDRARLIPEVSLVEMCAVFLATANFVGRVKRRWTWSETPPMHLGIIPFGPQEYFPGYPSLGIPNHAPKGASKTVSPLSSELSNP